mmetsp:Transcript_25888/g.72211  ORF Transcript_25888/g.72211 Transcript_25888/m.72211 type:complete len:294 (-) Transcript_25888:1272-2153(-)
MGASTPPLSLRRRGVGVFLHPWLLGRRGEDDGCERADSHGVLEHLAMHRLVVLLARALSGRIPPLRPAPRRDIDRAGEDRGKRCFIRCSYSLVLDVHAHHAQRDRLERHRRQHHCACLPLGLPHSVASLPRQISVVVRGEKRSGEIRRDAGPRWRGLFRERFGRPGWGQRRRRWRRAEMAKGWRHRCGDEWNKLLRGENPAVSARALVRLGSPGDELSMQRHRFGLSLRRLGSNRHEVDVLRPRSGRHSLLPAREPCGPGPTAVASRLRRDVAQQVPDVGACRGRPQLRQGRD